MSSQPLQETPESITQDNDEQLQSSSIVTATTPKKTSLRAWGTAFKQTFSCYLAVHLAFLVTTLYSVLFILKDFSSQSLPLEVLWNVWARKDAGHFRYIALFGYTDWWRTAFFPLYPLLERSMLFFTQSPYIAGLILSNIVGLIMLIVLYRLVDEDFGPQRAIRTVLYLSVFPTAFFFAAAYNESLFVCLTLLSFYYMRRGRWWLAGLFGFLASLTRSAGLLLLVPFAYEYFYQHQFNVKKIRVDILSGGLIPLGTGLFALYCYVTFHDALAFSHAQAQWLRQLHAPWDAYLLTIHYIASTPFLSFLTLRNLLDLVPDLFMLVIVVLSFVGPWRMPPRLTSYSLYALISYVFFQIFPVMNASPLTSVPRFLLELFPAFIVLAGIGKHRGFNLNYLMISGALLFFMLTQFLTGHWIT